MLAWQDERFEPPEPHEALTVLESQSPGQAAIDTLIQRITILAAGSQPYRSCDRSP